MSIYLDITDVVEFLKHHQTLSGIQRVQMELFRYFHDSGSPDVRFVAIDGSAASKLIDPAILRSLLDTIDAGTATRDSINGLISRLRAGLVPAQIGKGDVFFVSGAFWVTPDVTESIVAAKKKGALAGLLCYDLIPITTPDYTDRGLSIAFKHALDSALAACDFAFTISHHVKLELDRYLAQKQIDIPVIALPLAHQFAAPPPADTGESAILNTIAKDFVLFVSTIEIRKNHNYTLEVWRKLVEVMPENTPDLIWVGRQGWLTNDLLGRVGNLEFLDGRIKILNNLSDTDLAALYRNCLFTFYPSFAEGWGLPVAESLMFGKPVVSSYTTSLPEAGGDFPWYIDPYNITEGFELIRGLLEDRQRIRDAEERIARDFKPRTWQDVGEDLMRGMRHLQATHPGRAFPVFALDRARVFNIGADLGVDSSLSADDHRALRFLFSAGWYSAESWGRWMEGTKGRIDLHRPDGAAPGRYWLALELTPYGGWTGKRVTLKDQAGNMLVTAPPRHGQSLNLLAEVELSEGANFITIEVDHVSPSGTADPRSFSVGLIALGLADATRPADVETLRARFPQSATPASPHSVLHRGLGRLKALAGRRR